MKLILILMIFDNQNYTGHFVVIKNILSCFISSFTYFAFVALDRPRFAKMSRRAYNGCVSVYFRCTLRIFVVSIDAAFYSRCRTQTCTKAHLRDNRAISLKKIPKRDKVSDRRLRAAGRHISQPVSINRAGQPP